MIQDLHSHTYYSFCGMDRPETVIEAAIAGGIELFGISDHAHGGVTAERKSTAKAQPLPITAEPLPGITTILAS